ncbi:putative outer membrane starch-binding protein [Anseongella ginsenosidimutans]|uniref:Putative outer membrane starch-binding protein n=2 Tax=Anseongella ginsenosidimutans TaxID=496056 RepID=A0A4R3KML0_9SPHI|nr:RagB/SusD family nutrient uptake outer membrane protein [Anseongella ginsenosidimutans]TCS85267.1 putative outer membrane starch-binding protein [Anseongella ginsenosidimutans]
MKIYKSFFIALSFLGLNACNYLDVVPDNVATVDYAFRMRSQAEKYLFTCYSYLPEYGNWGSNPGLLTGDEIWLFYPYQTAPDVSRPPEVWEVARGNQTMLNPYLDYWDGGNGGKSMFQAIRDCNTFLENIHLVPDMDEPEKKRWIAEVKFLKAYYHWFLFRMYGPIPIVDANFPISSTPEQVQVYREPADSVVNYIVRLLDTAAMDLPPLILDQVSEMGRITSTIAKAVKAKVLITAASPLFNGNADYANFVDNRGIHLVNTTFDPSKWERAAAACKEAIDLLHENGAKLYRFNPAVNTYDLGPEMQTQMDIRNAVTEKWNSEIVWGSNNSMVGSLQRYSQAIIDPSSNLSSLTQRPKKEYAPSMKIAEMFYTENGLPIDADPTWDYERRYELDTATADDKYYIKQNYVTAKLHFDREPRFYADLGFDGGIWYGQGNFDQEEAWHVEGKLGQISGRSRSDEHSVTGYFTKKLVHFLNVLQTSGSYTVQTYPFPVIRLADLYLYYAEALNEAGRTTEAFEWINRVRERAGIPGVEESWSMSTTPGKIHSIEGFREIIQQERLIEMALEGTRYWDLLRWKKAESVINQPVRGWDVGQSETLLYYQPVVLFNQTFKKKNYLWPIQENSLIKNSNLVQNPGW